MDRLLHEAVVKGDVVGFVKIHEQNENSIKQTVAGSSNTVLHLAARFGHVELVSQILKLCPEMVWAENRVMETPLHEACREGHVDVMRMLLMLEEEENTAAAAAATTNTTTTTEPSVVYKLNSREQTALFVASDRGRVEVVKHLIIMFPRLLLLELDTLNLTSLHAAAAAGHTEIVRQILNARPDFARKTTIEGWTPLHFSCGKGHLETTRELLSLDPELSSFQDHEGKTPLHWAAAKGRVNILDEILSTDLESSQILTKNGETLLHLAVKNNQYDAVKYLRETLNITFLKNLPDNDGNTILHLATAGKLRAMVIYLLDIGVDVNALNRKGYTALDVIESDASNSGALTIVPTLLEAGAKRCDQLPPRSHDIQQIPEPSPTRFYDNMPYHVQSPWPRSRHSDHHSPPKSHPRKHNHRRSKQHELQIEGLRNARNTIIVVAVLIGTVTFAAGMNPPGGFNQSTGKALLGHKTPFKIFMSFNILALFLSLGIVNVLVSVVPFRRKSMTKLLATTRKVMWVSTLFMSAAYISAVWAIFPVNEGTTWVLAGLVTVGGGFTLFVYLGLGVLLVRHWINKREWRKRKEKKVKDGSPDGSINSQVADMMNLKKSRESSSNSDVDSSDQGFVVV